MKLFLLRCAVLIVLSSLVYTCYALFASNRDPESVTLVFSGSELGYLEPCGCSEGQLGGIARRDTFLQTLRTKNTSVLPLANGNLVPDNSLQSEIKADIGFLALAEMRYLVYNVGEHDLQLGIPYLTALAKQNRLPLLSANIYQEENPAFRPYLKHTLQTSKGPLTIGILGLLPPTYNATAEMADVHIVQPIEILKRVVPQLTATSDVIVCLFNGPTAEAAALYRNFPVLDSIVVSGEPSESATLPTQLINIEKKGKSVCSVQIHRDSLGNLVLAAPQRHVLDEQIPDAPRMTELLILYQEMLGAENLIVSTAQKLEEPGKHFVGNTACKTCHTDEGASWDVTKHSHAYHTLEVAAHETDPDCLTCHTVGFGFSSGFRSVSETPNHVNVGCESCHGAGNIHVEHPQQKGYGVVTETTCLKCHTTENSPNFEFDHYFPKIVHTSGSTNTKAHGQ